MAESATKRKARLKALRKQFGLGEFAKKATRSRAKKRKSPGKRTSPNRSTPSARR